MTARRACRPGGPLPGKAGVSAKGGSGRPAPLRRSNAAGVLSTGCYGTLPNMMLQRGQKKSFPRRTSAGPQFASGAQRIQAFVRLEPHLAPLPPCADPERQLEPQRRSLALEENGARPVRLLARPEFHQEAAHGRWHLASAAVEAFHLLDLVQLFDAEALTRGADAGLLLGETAQPGILFFAAPGRRITVSRASRPIPHGALRRPHTRRTGPRDRSPRRRTRRSCSRRSS